MTEATLEQIADLAMTNTQAMATMTTQLVAQHLLLRALLADIAASDPGFPDRLSRLVAPDLAGHAPAVADAVQALLTATGDGATITGAH